MRIDDRTCETRQVRTQNPGCGCARGQRPAERVGVFLPAGGVGGQTALPRHGLYTHRPRAPGAHLPHQAAVCRPYRDRAIAVPLSCLRLHVDVAFRPNITHRRRHPGAHPASERYAGAGREVRGEVGDAGQERGARGRGARVGEERGEVRSCVRLFALWTWGAWVSRGRLSAITGARGPRARCPRRRGTRGGPQPSRSYCPVSDHPMRWTAC